MAFLLAHLSDPHLTPPPGCGGSALKQRLGRRSWERKGRRHDPDVLAALVADVQARRPDHIAVTGDLTNFSTPAEKEAARAWLEALADPQTATVTPGNHDALVAAGPDPWEAWRPWMEDGPGAFPKVRARGRIMLFNVCSAVPTPVLSARGRVGALQRRRLEERLAAAGAAGCYRVVLLHHPVAAGAAPWRKALGDRARFAAVLGRAGAELVLHGHLHKDSLGAIPGPAGPIPVLGAPSASSAGVGGTPARWHAIEIEETGAGFVTRVTTRGLLPDGTMGEVGRRALTGR